MPNIFSGKKLDPAYIESVFKNSGLFQNFVPISIPIIPNTEVKFRNEGTKLYVKLVDSVQLETLSILGLEKYEINKKNYFEIKISKSFVQKKGYLKHLFQVLVIDFDYKLVSDSTQSIPGSMNFWKKIKKLEKTKCFIYNTVSKYKRQYKDQEDHEIWGLDEYFFIDDSLNTFAIESMRDQRKVNLDFYNYVQDNQTDILDRENIRLIIEKE